jgi:predicted ribosomally synthesized peptide with SipW-like signal peptide
MTKRLFLSFALITLVLAGVTSATLAYFTDGKVLGSNTFQTGNVSLGAFNVTNLNVTGLAPGKTVSVPNVAINYTGDLKADLYMGARGELGPEDDGYLADKTYLVVKKAGTSEIVWQGYVQALSTGWKKVATNTSAGWQAYDLEFTMDSNTGNSYQGQTNTDTEILIYSVQTGGSVPSTVPYQTTGTGWFNL